MSNEIKAGMKNSKEVVVGKDNLACSRGSGTAAVFATPEMLLLMECTCLELVAPYLEEGESTVGISASFSHMAATPEGMKITCNAELTEVDRKRLVFKVECFDEVEKIGEGTHQRFIVNQAKFDSKAENKAKK